MCCGNVSESCSVVPHIERRQMVLDAIALHIEAYGYPPTVREIADAVGVTSTSTVQGHLYNLRRDRKIRWNPKSPRTIVIIAQEISNDGAA